MRAKDQVISIFCILVGIGLLITASLLIEPIHEDRVEMGLVSNEPLENAPPSLAFATVAMGAFRGLVVDVLWIRADTLKEQGQFFDAKQLADWITIMQPRFATVWDFQAWNMAYNISVTFPATQCHERWRWVRNGYELLRDRGIELNPNSILLYRSLAWIFQHKIAGITDDCHKYYKREIAMEMRYLLEPMDNETFDKLIAAPETLDEIRNVADVSMFISELRNADQAFEDDDDFVDSYLTLRQIPGRFSKEAFEVIDKYRGTETLEKFDKFAKAHRLKNTWKMEPSYMAQLNAEYGPVSYSDPNQRDPLNWEHPHCHAIYWASLGLDRAGNEGDYDTNEKNTDRIVLHSLQGLCKQGKIVLYPLPDAPPSVFLLPDTRMFDTANRTWENIIDKYYRLEGEFGPTGMLNGHRNFLIDSIFTFFNAGMVEKAKQAYEYLRKKYPREDFNVPLYTFAVNRFKEEMQGVTIYDATQLIIMTLKDAYFKYALREDEASAERERWAKKIYDIYKAENEAGIDEEVEIRRLELPEFSYLRYQGIMMFLNDESYPEYMRRNFMGRVKVEQPELYEKLLERAESERKLYEEYQKQRQQQ